MKMIYLAKLIFISLLTLSSGLYAQITIGSHVAPISGALLEVKEKDIEQGNLGTSTKGVMLPRVALTNLTNLYPMFTGEEKDYAASKATHVGLMVYNTNVCAPTPVGVHSWDGSQWLYLGEERLSPNVKIYRDQDGNAFKAAVFGSAGIWMTENLAAKHYASSMGGGAIAVHSGATDNNTIAAYSYPNATPGNWGAAPSIWSRNQGLVYNWPAAGKGTTYIFTDQQVNSVAVAAYEVEMLGPLGTAPNKYVQGICPDGWHLPSDREWNQLEKEIYNNAGTYSSSSTSSFNPTSWVTDWGGESTRKLYMNIYRGSSAITGHGTAMRSSCPAPGSSIQNNGTSKFPAQGGFSALPLGYVDASEVLTYGNRAFFWSSSSGSDGALNANVSVYRSLDPAVGKMMRGNGLRQNLLSVRCKKNTNTL